MKLSTVKIETNGELTHLTVDGVDMSHALAVTYHHEGRCSKIDRNITGGKAFHDR